MSKLPGRVLNIVENPLFEKGADRSDESYYRLAKHIQDLMEKEREAGNI
jgi:hypothetical protein